MSDPPVPANPGEPDRPEALAGIGAEQPLTPGAARRRLGAALRALRVAADLTLEQVGEAVERSAATIHRYESGGRYVPREVEILALLNVYRRAGPAVVTNEVQELVLRLRAEGRKQEWYARFRDSLTGDMVPKHILKFVEYETDAIEIRSYESDRIPGLLQTYDYARAVAHAFFPSRDPVECDRFAEFRQARRAKVVERGAGVRLSFVVNEVALRRELGGPAVLHAQLTELLGLVRGEQSGIDLRIVPMATATPAAMDGPFVIMSFPENVQDKAEDAADRAEDPEDGAIVYLETRSGGTYLIKAEDVDRFNLYYESLLGSALPADEAVRLVESVIRNLAG